MPFCSFGRAGFPPADIIDEPEMLIATVLLPGMAREDITVTAAADIVEIEGRRSRRTVDRARCLLRERWFGPFRKVLSLPVPVDPDRTTARYRTGILYLVMPKRQRPVPRKISIT
jgi:HSP20 family protein